LQYPWIFISDLILIALFKQLSQSRQSELLLVDLATTQQVIGRDAARLLGFSRAHIGVVAVPLAFKAEHGLILHIILVILGQDPVQVVLSDLIFLAVGRLVAGVPTAMTSYIHHGLLEGK
jgi:hypothetical protein